MEVPLTWHARFQCVHLLVSAGFRLAVRWEPEPDAWHNVVASKSTDENVVALELVLERNMHRSVQVVLNNNECLLQTLDRSDRRWVEACAIKECHVRATDHDGLVIATMLFCDLHPAADKLAAAGDSADGSAPNASPEPLTN